MNESIVTIVSSIMTGAAMIVSIILSSRLTMYRINQLEQKVEKHNHLVERMAIVEQSTKSAHNRIDRIDNKG